MTEKQVYENLKRASIGILELKRFETGSTSKGVPDVYFLNKTLNRSGWIELKIGKTTPDGIKIKFRAGQQNVLRDLRLITENSFLLIFADNKYWLSVNFDDEIQNDFIWSGTRLRSADLLKCLLFFGRKSNES